MSDILLNTQPLFDKFIDIKFYSSFVSVGTQALTEIITPKKGIKPSITIQGQYMGSGHSIMPSLSLRLVNFYPSIPLREFRAVSITAGYRGISDIINPQPLFDTFSGQIQYAYQESPSPDGTTVFMFLPGNYEQYINAIVQVYYSPGFLLADAITDIAIKAGFPNPRININRSTAIAKGLNWTGSAKDLLLELRDSFYFDYRIDGNVLSAWDMAGSTGIVHEINYLSSPPQISAAGITFSAPWLPGCKPGDLIKIDPKYSRQNYGAAVSALTPYQKILSVEFGLNTVTDMNHMSVVAYNVETTS